MLGRRVPIGKGLQIDSAVQNRKALSSYAGIRRRGQKKVEIRARNSEDVLGVRQVGDEKQWILVKVIRVSGDDVWQSAENGEIPGEYRRVVGEMGVESPRGRWHDLRPLQCEVS